MLDGAAKRPLDYLQQSAFITAQSATRTAGDFRTACLQHYARVGVYECCVALVGAGVDPDAGWEHELLTSREIGVSSINVEVRKYFLTVGMLLGRYKLDKKPRHKSATCIAVAATDLKPEKPEQQRVMLKFMKDKSEFNREIDKRSPLNGGCDSQGKCCVVPILDHFHLQACDLDQILQLTINGAVPELLVVMPLAVEDVSDGA